MTGDDYSATSYPATNYPATNYRRQLCLDPSTFTRNLWNDVEKCPIGVYTRYRRDTLMEAYEALRCDDTFEDSAGRTYWLVAANHQGTFAAIGVTYTQNS
jgi:hypothetical protein